MLDTDPHVPSLSSLLEDLDSAEEAAGWGGPPQLVGVAVPTLSYVALPGHPLEFLLGWTALPVWSAIAVIAEAWAAVDQDADFERGTMTKRPSRTFGRQRVRAITVMGRDGYVASGIRYKEGEFTAMAEPPVGMVADAMRRALGLPTPPPTFPVEELIVQRWLAGLVASTKRGTRASVDVPAFFVPDGFDEEIRTRTCEECWDAVRRLAAKGRLDLGVTPEVAAWMDAGIFARYTLGGLPPLPLLLKQAKRRVDMSGWKRVQGVLRRWNLLDAAA